MNCGLGNLDILRRHLAPTLKNDTRFNDQLIEIGRGVAALFDSICNRKLAYAENFTEIFMGNRANWFCEKYPFIGLINTSYAFGYKVELRYFATDSWNDISSQPLIINAETGLFNFGYTLGPAPLQVRITYSGGYWFQTLEPDDANYLVCNAQSDPGYPDALPASITGSQSQNPPGIEPFKFLLPADLRHAWLLQCRHVFDSIDKLGLGIVDKPKQQTSVGELDLLPQVEKTLKRYIRYQAS